MAYEKRQADEPETEAASPKLIGPFLSPDPYGAGFVIPGPLTAGPPRPEPEERWTLGPGHNSPGTPSDEAQPAAEPTGPRERLRRLVRQRRA